MILTQPSQGEAIIELRGISKRFGDLWANRDIDLLARRGECHGVVGENGAGKSTLLQVLSGRWRPDRGEIRMGGAPVKFSSSRDAVRAGIGMVHQQLLVFPRLTALENILAGVPAGALSLGFRGARSEILRLSRSFGFDLPLDAPVQDLPFAQRQQIELLRAMHRGAEILILDEPTSLLSPPEVHRLLGLLRSLKEQGHTLLFVSHRLSEVFALAETITVLKKGRRVGSFARERTSPAEIARLMVLGEEGDVFGRASKDNEAGAVALAPDDDVEPRSGVPDDQGSGRSDAVENGTSRTFTGDGGQGLSSAAPTPTARLGGERGGVLPEAPPSADPLLELRCACAPGDGNEAALRDLHLRLWPREILGIGGVVGNGQRTLARAVAGKTSLSAGLIRFQGAGWEEVAMAQRLRMGLRWLPANLVEEGLCPILSLWENHLLGRQREGRFQTWGWLRKGAARRWTHQDLQEGGVSFEAVDQPVEALSGGNVQRVGLLRALSGSPRLLLLEQPGRGLDLSGQEWLRTRLTRLCEEGAAILVISYDLDELMRLCHRIGILFRGSLMGIAAARPSAEDQLVRWMTGIDS